ncbi:MAG: FaeA/PapI family transcriptional regulator [Candidatus Hadarchaeales archaeon]
MPRRSLEVVVERLTRTLLSAERPLTTREIAKRAGVDWKTARKLLNLMSRLSKVGVISSTRKGMSMVWKLEKSNSAGDLEMSDRLKFVFETFDTLYSIRDAARKQEVV